MSNSLLFYYCAAGAAGCCPLLANGDVVVVVSVWPCVYAGAGCPVTGFTFLPGVTFAISDTYLPSSSIILENAGIAF